MSMSRKEISTARLFLILGYTLGMMSGFALGLGLSL